MKNRSNVSNEEWVGLTEDAACAKASAAQVPFRVGARDGEVFVMTMDFVVGRVTASIQNGIVTGVLIEGM